MSAERLTGTPDFFPSLINAMPDGFVLRSTDGTIIEANASFCQMIGYAREEVIGSRPPHPWWAEEDRENIDQLASQFFAGASADDDMVFKRRGGERVPVAVTSAPLRDASGQIIAYVGAFKDMTERKRHQRQLAFQARLIDQVQAAVYATDDDGVITFWNRGAEELFGWAASDVIGVDVRNVLPGVGSAAQPDGALDALRQGTPWEGEYLARHRDGGTFPVVVTDAPILDQAGVLTGVMAVSVSIVERRRSEQRRHTQYNVARVLAEADDLGDGLQRVLSAIGSGLGWSFGGYWTLDADARALRCHDTWRSPDLRDRPLAQRLTDDWTFRQGEGLLGRVWESHAPQWVADLLQPSVFLRARDALESGFQSWIAFPVIGQRGVLGAVEFFSSEQREPETELLALVTSFGRQVGQFVERKRAEGALRESEDRFRTMADSAPVLLWLSGADGTATWFNRSWLDLRGRALDDELGHGWLEGVHPDDFDRCMSAYESARRAREPYTLEYRVRRHDGAYRWLLSNGAPRVGPDGTFDGYVGSCIDITDRRRVEEEQRFLSEATRILASSLDYQTTLSTLASLVAQRLADWCVVNVSAEDGDVAHSIIAHRDPEKAAWARDMLRQYPIVINAPHGSSVSLRDARPMLYQEVTDEQLQEVARDAQHLETLRQIEFASAMVLPMRARDRNLGAITFISAEGGRSYSESDKEFAEHLARRAAIAIDNALLYEEARRAARQRDQFLAVAAHELRSPLTSMKGFAQLLLRRAERQPLGEEWVRPLRTIDEQVNRLAGLVNRLLDVSRIEEDQLHLEVEEVDVADVVREAVSEAQLATEGHAITYAIDPASLLAEVDRTRIGQVLSNLIDNAVRYSPYDSPVEIFAALEGDQIVVSVTDYGPGIDEDAQQRLFERYFRGTHSTRGPSDGLGLGLYVARGIVEAHGGHISVASEPGKGSTFTFSVPRRSSAPR
ncbi:MAG TPA: PAS domain S-box protein [Thermomicrobiales bacterium]|nr:PAS domain S-box protein [Thermomicrobiales bacterium]